MALRRVWTSRPLGALPAKHRATIIVGEIVGLSAGTSVKVRITHSHHPDMRVGTVQLLCGKRLKTAIFDGDQVYDESSLEEITPMPVS